MAQEPIEMILLKHWASYVMVPIWITDAEGNLVYYNEPAEPILGSRFDDAGEISADRLDELFSTADLEGNPLPSAELPAWVAAKKQVPAHRTLRFQGMDGVSRVIEVTALPVTGQAGRHIGVMVAFWEPG
jgi:PAS domain-containing protein